MKRLAIIAACLVLAACTTTQVKLAQDVAKPPPNARVLALKPDVELSELAAAGVQQPRADWSSSARDNLGAALKEALEAKGVKLTPLDPTTVTEGRNAQVLRLNMAVNASILVYNLNLASLPTHKTGFNWTLGEGARGLGEAYGSDYALYVMARGNYSTSGRKLMFIAMAAAGVAIPMGGQGVLVSLVDLKTGRVVWYNLAQASPSADMRTPEGARMLMAEVLKTAPF
ncbi:MAG TPA: hypothetical protein VG939_05980 [Caulobacteraceae bacterium]|nr:hypothetical protein [Caulobacteraceae bacterium]